MKKINLLLLLLNLIVLNSFGQKKISGVYLNNYGDKIEVIGSEFNYIAFQPGSPIFYNDTLAKCSFRWIDDEFIELNSVSPYIIANKGLKFIQSTDSLIKDSIEITFLIPYQRSDLDVSVNTNTFKTFNLNYSLLNNSLILPKNIDSLSFSISPGVYLTPHSPDGVYYGILYYLSGEYEIDKNINKIKVVIPAMNNSFFEKYYVKGEYAKVIHDSITWKGDVFIKCDKE